MTSSWINTFLFTSTVIINIWTLSSRFFGSLDWFGLSDGTIVKLGKFQKTYSKRKVQSGEVMLYPIRQKDLYLYPWFDLFYRFKDDLRHTKTWIVIGYSFNDEFILNMFVEALVLDRDHKLILVMPNPNDVVKKFSPDNVRQVFSSRTKKM